MSYESLAVELVLNKGEGALELRLLEFTGQGPYVISVQTIPLIELALALDASKERELQ